MWSRRLSIYFFVAALLGGCASDPNVKSNPVPSAEKLKAADCSAAVQTYRQLLQRPPRVGMIVTNRSAPLRSDQEQESAAQTFAAQCQNELVAKARRAIVRCFSDAPDAETFRTCSQRF